MERCTGAGAARVIFRRSLQVWPEGDFLKMPAQARHSPFPVSKQRLPWDFTQSLKELSPIFLVFTGSPNLPAPRPAKASAPLQSAEVVRWHLSKKTRPFGSSEQLHRGSSSWSDLGPPQARAFFQICVRPTASSTCWKHGWMGGRVPAWRGLPPWYVGIITNSIPLWSLYAYTKNDPKNAILIVGAQQ